MGLKLDLEDNWVEFIALLFIILGFIVMQMEWLIYGSGFMTYMTIILGGMIIGRIFYKIDQDDKSRWFLISCGFLIGFLLGSHYGKSTTIVILYVLGAYASYYIHEKKYFKTTSF